jgi:hypothetical protein
MVLEALEAMVRDAVFMADLTADFLDKLLRLNGDSKSRKGPVSWPRGFLLDLAPILRIALWERTGLIDHLGKEFPPAKQALADLFRRYEENASDPEKEGAYSELRMEVFKTRFNLLAWGGRRELNADVVLGDRDDDRLLEALADLLWENRHLT